MKTLFKIFSFLWLMLAGMFELAIGLCSPGFTFVRHAVTQNPLIGRMKKGVGNLISYTSYGQNVLRSKPLEVNDANSSGQQAQRTVFTKAQTFCRRLLNAINIGFVNYKTNMSAYSFAIGQNMNDAKTGGPPEDDIDLALCSVSKGNLIGFGPPTWSTPAGEKIKLQWTDNSGTENGLATDCVYMCGIKADLSKHGSELTGTVKRNAAADEWVVPGAVADESWYFYAFLTSADGTLVSDSICSGAKTIVT